MSKACWNIDGALGEAPLSSERSALVLYSLKCGDKKDVDGAEGFLEDVPIPWAWLDGSTVQ